VRIHAAIYKPSHNFILSEVMNPASSPLKKISEMWLQKGTG